MVYYSTSSISHRCWHLEGEIWWKKLKWLFPPFFSTGASGHTWTLASGWRENVLPFLPVTATDPRRERKKFKNIFFHYFSLSRCQRLDSNHWPWGCWDICSATLPVLWVITTGTRREKKVKNVFFTIFLSPGTSSQNQTLDFGRMRQMFYYSTSSMSHRCWHLEREIWWKKLKILFPLFFSLSVSAVGLKPLALGMVRQMFCPLYHFYESSPLAPGERKRLKMFFFSLFFSLLVPVAGLEPLASGWRDKGSTTLPLLPVAATDTRRERKKFKKISTIFLSPGVSG